MEIKKDLNNFINELFQKEKDKCNRSGSKFGYSTNEREILESMTKSIQEKYPQIKIDNENLTNMIKWQLSYAYCDAERSRFYSRENYDDEERMEEAASNAMKKASNEQDIFVDNIIQASNITAETFNEELFEKLRQNKFRGGFTNPLLDAAYKNYYENKEKEHSLQELKSENSTLKETVQRYESVINYDNKVLDHLIKANENLQTTLSEQKNILNSISNNLDDTQREMHSLNGFIQQEKNIFTRLSERFKGLFNKAPKLPGIDTSYNTILGSITNTKTTLDTEKAKLQEDLQNQIENSLSENDIKQARKSIIYDTPNKNNQEKEFTK